MALNGNNTLVGEEALTRILQELKDEMPTLATESEVRSIVTGYNNSN